MSEKNVPEWVLERYIHGELPDFMIKEIRNLLKEDLNLKEKLIIIRKSDKNILEKYPSGLMVPNILDRFAEAGKKKDKNTSPRKVLLKRVLIFSPALALILILIWILPIIIGPVDPALNPVTNDSTRTKGMSDPHLGKPQIIIHREHLKDGIEQLKNGDRAKTGDLIQLAYMAGEELYGIIFSIDGNGVVTLHFPNTKKEPTALKTKKKIYLPYAYQLDNAPHFERFFFITSKKKFDISEVLGQAKKLAENPVNAKTKNIQLYKDLSQFSVLIIKGD